MATLYYTATSCGAASYISAKIGGLFEKGVLTAHKVDIGKGIITATGANFEEINPKGNVPALKLADGLLLNEGAATLQWIADQAPESGLAPAHGTSERYLLINSLNFLASELHTSFGPLFYAKTEEEKPALRERVAQKLALAEGLPQIHADKIDVAAVYLYIILSWSKYVGVDLTPFPKLLAFSEKVAAHTAVAAAHTEMNAAP